MVQLIKLELLSTVHKQQIKSKRRKNTNARYDLTKVNYLTYLKFNKINI